MVPRAFVTRAMRAAMRSWCGYPSFAVRAGLQLDLFSPLAERRLSAEQLATALQDDPVRLRPLLYPLVTANLLTVENGRFANTPLADAFLVRGKPGYMGSVHEL